MIESLNTLAFQATGMDISPSNPGGVSLENPRNSLGRVFDLDQTYVGRAVTPSSALGLSTVWRCASIISGTVAKTQTNVYRRTPQGKQLATDHYLYTLFRTSANPHMSAFRFFRLMQVWQLLWGNAYAEIEMNGRGQITALWPMRPDRMRVWQDGNGDLFYLYDPLTPGLQGRVINEHFMFHLRGLETDGITGLSVIGQARQGLGLSMAAEEFGARFFGNNARPGIYLKHPGALSDKAKANLISGWENLHRGLQGSHRVGVLEEGMELVEVGIPPEDAQFLQTRQHQDTDICRWFGVQPHKAGILDRATNNNIEQQALEFVQDTMDDHFCNWEYEAAHTLLSARESQTIYVEFNRSKLIQGDYMSRAKGHVTYRQNGVLSADEIREDLGYNPIPEPAADDTPGKKFVIQLNMQELDQVGEAAQEAMTAAEQDNSQEEDAKQ